MMIVQFTVRIGIVKMELVLMVVMVILAETMKIVLEVSLENVVM